MTIINFFSNKSFTLISAIKRTHLFCIYLLFTAPLIRSRGFGQNKKRAPHCTVIYWALNQDRHVPWTISWQCATGGYTPPSHPSFWKVKETADKETTNSKVILSGGGGTIKREWIMNKSSGDDKFLHHLRTDLLSRLVLFRPITCFQYRVLIFESAVFKTTKCLVVRFGVRVRI